MAYTPDPNNSTQPEDGVDASTAAAEFRALKTKVNNLVLDQAAFLVIAGVPKAVQVGAADSGGAGFRMIRVVN